MELFFNPFDNLLCILLGISFTVWFTLLLVFIIVPAIFGVSFGIRRIYMKTLLKIFEVRGPLLLTHSEVTQRTNVLYLSLMVQVYLYPQLLSNILLLNKLVCRGCSAFHCLLWWCYSHALTINIFCSCKPFIEVRVSIQ